MFQELVPLVRACDKLVLTLTMVGDEMSVIVAPVAKKALDGALTTPLALKATPADLDEGFAAAVQAVTESHRSLAEQAEATSLILDAAKASQSSKATKSLSRPKASANADKSSAAGDSDAGDDDSDAAEDRDSDAAVMPAGAEPRSSGTDLASLL
ncbi:PRTRC system protein E [Cupriavidus basilensis]|uniref:PRTRC system protein E n=1 Tax=Cupriavidus basilensis TaxID=68895 RepID=UPI00075182BC|nr:PRTRC system protein E [Cupriavidus basilensis]